MAYVLLPLLKLIQYVELFFNSKKSIVYLCKNNNNEVTRNINIQPTLMISSSVLQQILKKEKEDVLHNFALATLALKDGNLEKSAKLLMKTLNLAEASNLFMETIITCDILSSLAIKLGDYEKAEDFLIRAIDNLISQGTPDDNPFLVSFNLKLSRIYSLAGNDELAELGFRNCLNIQNQIRQKHSNEDALLLYATILYWYGKFLLGSKRFEEAKYCFENCYTTSTKVSKLLPSQTMVVLYNLGEVCQNLGEYDEALRYLLKGLSLDRREQNIDVSYFYTKLGTISMCMGMFEEAKIWCEKGHKIAITYQNVEAEKESRDCLNELNNIFTN